MSCDDESLEKLTERLRRAVEALDKNVAAWGTGSRKLKDGFWIDLILDRWSSARIDAMRRRKWLRQEIAETMHKIEKIRSRE